MASVHSGARWCGSRRGMAVLGSNWAGLGVTLACSEAGWRWAVTWRGWVWRRATGQHRPAWLGGGRLLADKGDLGRVMEIGGTCFQHADHGAKVVRSRTLMGSCASKILGASAQLKWCAEI